MTEIKYKLVRYKRNNKSEIGILLNGIVIDYTGKEVIYYYDLQVIESMITGNRWDDIGIDVWGLMSMAWKLYLEKLDFDILPMYKN